VSTGGVAGRPATARLKSPALAIALVAIAVLPSTALATTDRTDYAAQVNPICVAASARDQQLSQQAEERFAQLHRQLRKARGQRRDKLLALDRKLSTRRPDRHLAIRYDELRSLRSVAAAPGDEILVSTWLDTRKASLDLNHRLNRIDQKVERLFKLTSKTLSIDVLTGLDKKIRKLDKRASRVENNVIAAESTDFDLATELGATECVADIL
jgi:hypothetical protein